MRHHNGLEANVLTDDDRQYLEDTKKLITAGRTHLEKFASSMMGKMAMSKAKEVLGGETPEDLLARIERVIAIAEKAHTKP